MMWSFLQLATGILPKLLSYLLPQLMLVLLLLENHAK